MKTKIIITITILLIILDQFTKYYVVNIKPKLSRICIIDDGIIFGIFGISKLGMNLIILLSLIVTIVAILFYSFYISKCRQSFLMDIFVLCFCSGIISNTIDRILIGGGRDFIDALGFYMNVADIYMDIGFICLISELIINRQCEVKLITFPKIMIQNMKEFWSKFI